MIDTENNTPLIERVESGEFEGRPAELAQLALDHQDNLTPDELIRVLKSIASEKDESLSNDLGRNKIAETLDVNTQIEKFLLTGIILDLKLKADVGADDAGFIYLEYDAYSEYVDVELYIKIFAEGREPVEFLLERSVGGCGSKRLTPEELGFDPKKTPYGYMTYLKKARKG